MTSDNSDRQDNSHSGWLHRAMQQLEHIVGRFFYPLLVMLAIATVSLVFWNFSKAQDELILRTAVQHADVYSEALTTFRTIYTSELVDTARRHGLRISHDYKNHDTAIPLPTTLSMELGRILGEHNSGGRAQLYSPFPFPWRDASGGLQDPFAQDAWSALTENPSRAFFRIENTDGIRVLRYATADLMRPACVECHNTHPESPRADWREGDLRGVLEITYPIAHASDLADRGARSTAVLLTPLLLTGALGLGLVSLRRSRRRAGELESANRRLAEEMQQRQDMEAELRLAQKLEAIGQLAAGVAHEVNTPMQFIGDNTHFLQTAFNNMLDVVESYQGVVDSAGSSAEVEKARATASTARLDFIRERVPRALETTIEGVEVVSRIVRAMKNFSHVGGDVLAPNDLNKAIEDTITISKGEWKYVAELETDLDPTMPPVPCLVSELNQVFLIIIVNAAHAIAGSVRGLDGEKGSISIRTRYKYGSAVISITDTGSGIDESVRDKIFDPFFTTKEFGHGNGQGLAIARNIVVEKHAGSISFDTELGVGTTFHITIPIDVAEQDQGETS